MKKLWVNTVPRRDPNADEIFYYPQELPKYLRGFHKCTKQDAIKIAALIYRVKYDTSISELQNMSQIIDELVPADLVKAQNISEWKKTISAAYSPRMDLTVLESKQEFLENVYKWPTFGSAFFNVKQTTEPNFPEVITIAINKNGVNIIHPINKVVSMNFGCGCIDFCVSRIFWQRIRFPS